MIALVIGEWFKLRRRLLPYILLAILVLIAQAFLVGFYIAHRVASSEEVAYFLLPASIDRAIDSSFSSFFAPILMMVLAASSLGTEYGWGTLRSTIAKGPGRTRYLTAKLLAAALLGAAAVLIMSATVVATSAAAALATDAAVEASWSDAAAQLAKALYVLLPYIAMGSFFVVLTQSTAQGVTLSIVFFVVEALTLAPLLSLNSRLEVINDFLLSRSMTDWLEAAGLRSFTVLTAYAAVPYTAALWIFNRRDIGGPRGE